ncbi:SCO family protein [Stutzerimonas kirkiae]|uniref:Cytochrome c oxidase assembly protein n=1 Tax=Stutzerimonas kirkiae TaxID=2211392 RepID=A0A4Q9RCA3_9GAMM|nr:SCO family protein [Stutzerimonas kirkiae]TBU98681.1 cytochrome c oxidase assembly protein [Stutzerimonas kirkiae]TBV00223.1 cytochrome c oxidase assembly protein [Stutzerimonas kirkiae]TBV06043.1 cytochrome c oxidase assembly protein [Stutzerimonas kirkiae]TBV14211.1 cytochrome c oxidase assembly protein [Stutzerimonas kirkiae]
MTRIQKTVFISLALIALIAGLILSRAFDRPADLDPARLVEAGIVLLPQPRLLPELELTNQDGEPVRVDQLNGRWSLLFFGYTFCPDICPTTLVDLRQLKEMLPPEMAERLQPILVSVDPRRDTPEQLKQYLSYFKSGFQGLTGPLGNIQALANSVGIPFIPADPASENYTVDHSGNLAIIGPDGRQHGFIRGPLKVRQLSEQLPPLIR